MSNPAVYALSETRIRNIQIRIEDNLGESIHIHIGDFRISLSVEEFYFMVNQVEKGAEELLSLDGINLKMFDKTAFDWDWIHRYQEIENIEFVNVRLGDLLTKGESEFSPDLDRIVSVADSRCYKALKGDYSELERCAEKNVFGVTKIQRINNVCSLIREKGYPYDDKYIIVNQYNQIYDGDHRAACLLHLKGQNEIIPVLKITFKNELSIEDQKQSEKKEYAKYIERLKNKPPVVRNWSEELNILNVDYETFRQVLNEKNINYFSINQAWSVENGETIADKVIIIEENKIIEFCKKMNVSYYGKCRYRHYQFLYSMQRCVYIELTDVRVLVFDRLSCESKFENAIMPLDKVVQLVAWEKIENNNANIRTEMIFCIVNALLNADGFSESSKEFIEENKHIFDDGKFRNMCENIFFNYTDNLFGYLKEEEYEQAYIKYLTNRNY